jgi:hypothetical protein
MPNNKLQQYVDNILTNYLRNTTTDQEILDFYGEGNVVGRKGIPETDKDLLDAIDKSNRSTGFRPTTGRKESSVGGIDQEIGYSYSTKDIPGLNSPETGRPWQMTFGALPKDFGSGSLTPAAKQFLSDFRVPKSAGFDYSFATGPNIQDRVEKELNWLKEGPRRSPENFEELRNEIVSRSSNIGEYSGQPQTPTTWKERGYITEKPQDMKEKVLSDFKNRIFETQGQFGGTSTLTPVRQSSSANPDWRAELYEKAGMAGPVSSQYFSSGYGGGSKDVQRFTTGKERLLPLQPYTEFFQQVSGGTRPSAVGIKPAPDFTPFQKAVGPRNYLIGRNILEGRGSLGAPVRAIQEVPITAKRTIVPATKGFLLDAAIQYGLGASPQESLAAAATDLISAESLGGSPTAAIERLGPQGQFVDTRTNTVFTPQGRPTNTGIAYKGGKPVIVKRGSVAGEGNIITQTQQVLGNALNTWKQRLGALGIFGR